MFNYCGKEFSEKYLKDYTVEQNYKIEYDKTTYDVAIKINIEKFALVFLKKPKKGISESEKEKLKEEKDKLKKELEEFAKNTAEILSNFRVNIYSFLLEKMLTEIKNKNKVDNFVIRVNNTNKLTIIALPDRIQLLFGINFSQKTDISLCKIFLQELSESKKQVKNCIDAKVYTLSVDTPKNFLAYDKPGNYSNGLVQFDLYVNNLERLKVLFSYFVTFREYVQFHIHSIKTFLHIRMNKKFKDLRDKITGCKIIPEDYIKGLETINFYDESNKKEERQKIFTEAAKKVNV